MANLMQIKRSENTAVPTSLSDGELAFSGNGDILYVGNFGSVTAVGGARTPGTLTANQAIVVDSNSTIDNIIATDLEVKNQLTANGSVGTAGQVLYSGGTANAYWADSASGALSGLEDTNITSPADASLLIYDFQTSKWVDNVISGDATVADTGVLTLASSGVTAATYGSASVVPAITVDAKGRVTGVTNTNIAIASGAVSGLAASATTDTTNATNITSGTLNSARLPDLAVADFGGAAIQTGTEVGATGGSIGDNDTSLLTAAAVINYVEGKNYSTTTGTVTSVGSGNGLTGGPITGSGTLAVGAGNGVSVNSTAVAVNAQAGLVANSSGLFAAITLGTHTDSNYVSSITGTANEVEVSASTGAVQIGLPNNVTIGNNLTVSGNLVVSGTTTTVNSTTLTVDDPLIRLADGNNTTDALDIGFYGIYDSTGSQDLFAGVFRDADDNKFKFFTGLQSEPTTTVNTGGTGYNVATIVAHLEDSNVSITGGTITGITDLTVGDGGTGRSTFTDNGIVYGDGSNALDVTAAGTEGQVLQAGASGVPVFGSLDGGTF